MTQRMKVSCCNYQQATVELRPVLDWIKAMLTEGHRMQVEARKQTRSLEQNAKFHAICDDLSKSGVQWAGKTRNPAQWKVLLVSGHSVATRDGSDMVPGIEGEFVNLRESTASMTRARGSSLIEYSLAFCAMHDVKIGEPASLLEQQCRL